MLKALYTCDQCGAEKRNTNHWFVVREIKSDNFSCLTVLQIHPFEDGGLPIDQHICGQACLVQAVSEFASRSGSAAPAPSAHLGAARTAPVLSSEDA